MDSNHWRTLVVDDAKSIRLVINNILNRLGVTDVTCCSGGHEALSVLKETQEKFDLIFVDLNMPDMDGMELIRNLGIANFDGAVVIASQMESRVINLASEIAKNNRVHLIGNLKKPFDAAKMDCILEKYRVFRQRTITDHTQLNPSDIEQAIKECRLTPYYQPKIDIKTNRIHSLELLARIDSPGSCDAITPISFISVAEEHNLIDGLLLNLVESAIADFTELESEIGHFITLAINVSPIQLNNLDFPNKLDALIQEFGIDPAKIVFEVTEESAISTNNQLESLNRLRIKGYGVSLDDFGTGFTNVGQLLSLPFTEVKIDRCLISGINDDYFSQVIVNSLIDITNKLDISLVAEGIETIEELHYFEKFKSLILLQGYIFTKPKPKNELIRWHHSWSKL